jgi:hypothetical protein
VKKDAVEWTWLMLAWSSKYGTGKEMITGVTLDKVETLSERRYTNENREIADKNIRGLMGGQKRIKLFVFIL